ncbi:MAG: GTP cyclohydrolase FolE2 [Marinobacter sp.]|nr:GTP cyclohydrolase FolE2 [Marinobacter sp.]
MSAFLPDVAQSKTLIRPAVSIDWVGMGGISLPFHIDDTAGLPLCGLADIGVDLGQSGGRGIHMSRLYRHLLEHLQQQAVTPVLLRQLLSSVLGSHGDCLSTTAQVTLQFVHLAYRSALVTKEAGGWNRYPVSITGHLKEGVFSCSLQVEVTYSSTCPCSAALARQSITEIFDRHFQGQTSIGLDQAKQWLSIHGTSATPHSQRSVARIEVQLAESARLFELEPLIDRVETAIGTPVQTAVKRQDEQAFALLNGMHLQFVEDVVRKLSDTLYPLYEQASIDVRHLESLHAHDAVARKSWNKSSEMRPPTQGEEKE